ncbi:MAG: hypothetical protein IPO27_05255 [Bacteroidetes bacterium]|nr:hypothetical protein [Bacteroidota bacterium]
MKFIIVYQQIWTTVNDPYTGTTVQDLKSEFTNWWDNNRSNIDRDVTHMFSNIVLIGNTIGYASNEAVCSSDYYSVVLHRSPFSLCVNLSAHELGHNFGGFHDFSCNGAIMCPIVPSACSAG